MNNEHEPIRTPLKNKRHRCCRAGQATVELNEYTDSAIAFSSEGAENFIYLYPEQVDELTNRLIARRLNQIRKLREKLLNP